MMFAVKPSLGVRSFADIRERKLPLRIAVSTDDGTSLIGYVSARILEAHGLDESTVQSWGGSWVKACRPDQVIALVKAGQADAVMQEAIMTPWWSELIESQVLVSVPVEDAPMHKLASPIGFRMTAVKANFWNTLAEDIPCVDFSDFVVLVRADMPDDVAHLLTWCLIETREVIEAQYRHIPPERSRLTYPLEPAKMARSTLPLHPAAEKFYRERGFFRLRP
jgi:TRAP-type uncharacterized transport system substrate-binding protein